MRTCAQFEFTDTKKPIITTRVWGKYSILELSKMSKIYIVQPICWYSISTRVGDLLIQVIDDGIWEIQYCLIFFIIYIYVYIYIYIYIYYIEYFPSHVHTNILKTHKKRHKVIYHNPWLKLKVSGFYKSLFVRDFAGLFHLQ